MDYNNFKDEIFNELPEVITGSNFENCAFNNAENTEFVKCNIRKCTFKTISNFSLSNLIETIPVEGSELDRSNVIEKEEEEFLDRDLIEE